MNYNPVPTISAGGPMEEAAINTECMTLRNAIAELDMEKIIRVLTTRSNHQRVLIRDAYQSHFHRDVIADFEVEFRGDIVELITGLVLNPMHYASKCLNKAIGRTGIHVKTFTEILVTQSNDEINKIKDFYSKEFKIDLSEHVLAETVGGFRQLLEKIINNGREENVKPSRDLAQKRASELKNLVNENSDAFPAFFINLLATENLAQLRLIIREFDHLNEFESMDKLIDHHVHGDLRVAGKVIVDIARSPPIYFATRINKALEGWVKEISTVIRIIISRSEIDLGNIKAEYRNLYDKDLARDIKSHTKEEVRRCLLAIVNRDEKGKK